MNADSSREPDPRGAADDRPGWASPIEAHRHGATTTVTYSYEYELGTPDPEWRVDHDHAQRVFRLTGPDGQTECFRDRPLRYVVVTPDPETGELRPEIRSGQPRILCLCREEREVS
jgi:hypothetical protein